MNRGHYYLYGTDLFGDSASDAAAYAAVSENEKKSKITASNPKSKDDMPAWQVGLCVIGAALVGFVALKWVG